MGRVDNLLSFFRCCKSLGDFNLYAKDCYLYENTKFQLCSYLVYLVALIYHVEGFPDARQNNARLAFQLHMEGSPVLGCRAGLRIREPGSGLKLYHAMVLLLTR